MERQCKFHVVGCQYVGAGADLKDHLVRCSFEEKNKKIKCQKKFCKKDVRMREMVQHLKDDHNAVEKIEANASGKILIHYFVRLDLVNDATWTPQIWSFNNQTFFLHADLYQKIWTFWVAVLGNEGEAKKYEVELTIPKKEGRNFYMGFKGKIFSSDQEVLTGIKERENILRLGNNLAEVRADGTIWFTMNH